MDDRPPYPRDAALKWSLGPAAVIAAALLVSTSAAVLAGVAATGLSALMIAVPQVHDGAWRRRYHAIGTGLALAALVVAYGRYEQHRPAPLAALAPGDQRAAMEATAAADAAAREARLSERKAALSTGAEADDSATPAASRTAAACDGAGEAAALSAARYAVRQRLKNPRGARFAPNWETSVLAPTECTRRVTAWVDAANGYGAVIRSRWGVDLEADGQGDWRVALVFIE